MISSFAAGQFVDGSTVHDVTLTSAAGGWAVLFDPDSGLLLPEDVVVDFDPLFTATKTITMTMTTSRNDPRQPNRQPRLNRLFRAGGGGPYGGWPDGGC